MKNVSTDIIPPNSGQSNICFRAVVLPAMRLTVCTRLKPRWRVDILFFARNSCALAPMDPWLKLIQASARLPGSWNAVMQTFTFTIISLWTKRTDEKKPIYAHSRGPSCPLAASSQKYLFLPNLNPVCEAWRCRMRFRAETRGSMLSSDCLVPSVCLR